MSTSTPKKSKQCCTNRHACRKYRKRCCWLHKWYDSRRHRSNKTNHRLTILPRQLAPSTSDRSCTRCNPRPEIHIERQQIAELAGNLRYKILPVGHHPHDRLHTQSTHAPRSNSECKCDDRPPFNGGKGPRTTSPGGKRKNETSSVTTNYFVFLQC